VDSTTVGEVVGVAPVVDPTVVGEEATVQAWRQSRSGRTGGKKMIVATGMLTSPMTVAIDE
jgi:hypothetical protein